MELFNFDLPARERTTNSLIFEVISDFNPWRIAAIQSELRSKFHTKLTYQAIRKALRSLAQKGIVETSKRGFILRRAWLYKVRAQVNRILVKGDPLFKSARTEKFVEGNRYRSYEFTSLYEADIAWGELILEACERNRGKKLFCISCYAWWTIINLGREAELFNRITALKIHPEIIMTRRSWLNAWAKKAYAGNGVPVKIVQKPTFDESRAIEIIGDYVIEAEFPIKTQRAVQQFIESFHSIEEVDSAAIVKLAHSNLPVRLSVYINAVIANTLMADLKR